MPTKKTWLSYALISVAFLFLLLFLFLPLIVIFSGAFAQGFQVFVASITEPDALSAIQLTLLVVVITVPLHTLFGLAAAWALTKFQFKGRQFLITLIEIPFAVSPVIAGLLFILLYGVYGFFWRMAHSEWLPSDLCLTRNHSRDDVCHVTFCRSRTHSANGSSRVGSRRSFHYPWCQRLANLSTSNVACY